MPIISPSDCKCWRGRTAVALVYGLLVLGSITMVVPFLITLTGSVSTDFDYERRTPLPRFLWSRSDRLLRTLCGYFPPSHRGSIRQLRSVFPSLPPAWQIWAQIGDERDVADAWAETQLARIEFAAHQYDAKLVVVLGHTGCGAMNAALAAVRSGREPESANLRMLVEKIRPAVECAIEGGDGQATDVLADLAGRENVRRAVDVIRNDPGVIRKLVDDEGLEIVGAEYSLATGVVEFF